MYCNVRTDALRKCLWLCLKLQVLLFISKSKETKNRVQDERAFTRNEFANFMISHNSSSLHRMSWFVTFSNVYSHIVNDCNSIYSKFAANHLYRFLNTDLAAIIEIRTYKFR